MSARAVFLFLYFISGATALLYQVVWARRLTLEMGQTSAAVSTVLAAFMGGLALGAHLGGRVAGTLPPRTALTWYAALEAAVALLALLVGPMLSAAQPLLVMAYQDGSGSWFFLTRLALSLLVVAVPATAMGATLPAAVRWFEHEGAAPHDAGRMAGLLYAANTVGAAAGAALTGFVMLPWLGLSATTAAGAAANLAVAFTALGLSRIAPTPPAAPSTPPPPKSVSSKGRHARRRTRATAPGPAAPVAAAPVTAALVLAISGFAALVHEVVWTRVIALVLGPTTYAFTTMVTIFIVGLGVGSALGARLLRRRADPLVLLAWAQVVAAVGALVAATLVPRIQLMVAAMVATSGSGLGALMLRETVTFFVVLLPLTLALGASFPFAVAAAAPARLSATGPVSLVYKANTLGAIAGALAGGYVLLPRLGLLSSLLAAAAIEVATALGLAGLSMGTRRQRLALAAASASVLLLAWWQPPWNRALMAGGLYRPAAAAAIDPAVDRAAGTLLYYGDGSSGSVSVRRIAGETSLAINGKVDASNGADMLTQKLLAHVPLLLHPSPRDVLVIGFGSGVTTGAALTHPVRAVHSVELSPEVVQASAFFARENRDALRDPRSRLLVGDGRSHLRLSRQRYDVIISEPSNPWMAGVAPLFTREMFAAARDRLLPGGLFCQWAHTYEMSRADLGSIVATFVSVFPGSSLWLIGEGDVLIVGARDGNGAEKLETIASAWNRPGVSADLASISVLEPAALLALHAASDGRLAGFARGARIQTDDATSLEFSAPASLFGARGASVAGQVRQLAEGDPRPAAVVRAEAGATAASWISRARLLLSARAYDSAWTAARRALELNPDADRACEVMARAAAPLGRVAETLSAFREASRVSPAAIAPRVALSRLQAASGQSDAALDTAIALVQASPNEPRAVEQLASVVADAGDGGRLRDVVTQLERVAPETWAAVYYRATLDFLEGRLDAATQGGERAALLNAADARPLTLVGAAYASAGQMDLARAAFRRSLVRNPRDPITSINLGRLELSAGRVEVARAHFADALLLDPTSSEARRGFDQAEAAMSAQS